MALRFRLVTLGGVVLASLSACGPAEAPLTDADRRALTESVVAGMNGQLVVSRTPPPAIGHLRRCA